MLIFFDCEFTELGIDPKLISIGFVSEDGTRELYAELCDTYQPSDCSDFVREAVLPHLEGGDARMTMRELSVRLVDWLIAFGEPVQLATDSLSWDWPWIGELYAEAGEGTDWPAHMTTHGKAEVFRPANVDGRPYVLTQSPSFNLAVEAAFASGLRRHHALDDAKANRLGWQALIFDQIIKDVGQKFDVRGSILATLVISCLDHSNTLSKEVRTQYSECVPAGVFDFIEQCARKKDFQPKRFSV